MSDAMPSKKLMFMLALSLVLAAATIGRSFIATSGDESPEVIWETFDTNERVGAERLVIEDWQPPEAPRDPFLQVDLGLETSVEVAPD